MAELGLRPLSLGEILDRTFTLYRNNFVLFVGIGVIPQLLVLAINMCPFFFAPAPAVPGRAGTVPITKFPSGDAIALAVIAGVVTFAIVFMINIFTQGAAIFAVSEIYLGRTITIGESLRRSWSRIGTLIGVGILDFLVVLIGFICLIIPGIFLALRLMISVPAAVVEDLAPRASLERSYALTKDFAGRAFLICLLYFVLAIVIAALFAVPFGIGVAAARHDPAAMRYWNAFAKVGDFFANVLVTPILLIATSVFYYDLRVRKEAFDLQLMMHPSGNVPSAPAPSMLS